MELTIRTSELQDMVSKVIKCSSNNKLLPLTSLMSIKVESNFLTLATTDGTNYFYSKKEDRTISSQINKILKDFFKEGK